VNVQGSGIAAMPGLASFSVFGEPINSRVRRRFIQRGFHQNKPLLVEIVQRIDEILWNICRLPYPLHPLTLIHQNTRHQVKMNRKATLNFSTPTQPQHSTINSQLSGS